MVDLNALPLPQLFHELTADGSLDRLISAALREDLGERGDVTSRAIIGESETGSAALVAREAGVVSGLAAAPAVLAAADRRLVIQASSSDGRACSAGETLGRVDGPLRAILAAERTLLNILGRLSGIATLTRRYVDAVSGTRAQICDTRKTTPGLRALEKYAVRCGGGTMHRLGLHDAVLFKDNHLARLDQRNLTSALNRAARTARTLGTLRFVEVEVDNLDQLRQVLRCESGLIDMILLDNMSLEQLRQAVKARDESGGAILLEASGGVDLTTVRAVAETGVDRISVGALTHSAPALDVALDLIP